MECREFVDTMQEGELAELRGEGGTPLAEHVRGCRECAAYATHVLAATDRLAASLMEESGRGSVVGVRRVLAAIQPSWRRRFAGLAVSAAALVTLAVGLDRAGVLSRDVPLETPSDAIGMDQQSTSPGVDVPAGRNAVVFRTSNPKITVVWYYPSEGGP
jgi:hypothetical protein